MRGRFAPPHIQKEGQHLVLTFFLYGIKSKAQISQNVAADSRALRPASYSWGSMNRGISLKCAKERTKSIGIKACGIWVVHEYHN
jgi:hypothetical protein